MQRWFTNEELSALQCSGEAMLTLMEQETGLGIHDTLPHEEWVRRMTQWVNSLAERRIPADFLVDKGL